MFWRIPGDQENLGLNIIDAGVELTLGNGSTINIEEQFVLNTSSNLVEISENGFIYKDPWS